MSELCAREVGVRRGGQRILRDVSVALRPGGLTAVVGPNGAGKSTLLWVLSGDLEPESGWVGIDGHPLRALSDVAQAHRRAVMAQFAPVAFAFTALDIVRMGWLDGVRPEPDRAARVERETLLACGLEGMGERAFHTLSGGERQRVQLARALLQLWRSTEKPSSPRYLLLDEPTSSLDVGQELAMLKLVRTRLGPELGALAVLHDLNLAARFADEVLLIDRGACVAHGSPETVLDAEQLSRVYGVPVHVERHAALGRTVVLT